MCGVGKRALAMHFVKRKEPIIVSAVKSDGSTLVGQELEFCTQRFSILGGIHWSLDKAVFFWLNEQLLSCS